MSDTTTIGTENIYANLLFRLVFVMILYTVCRLTFIGFNQDLMQMSFDQVGRALLGGLKFDLSGVLYVNALFMVLCILPLDLRHHKTYRQIAHWVFVITNAIGLAANLIDVNYFPYTLKRSTIAVFQEFSNEGRLGGGFGSAVIEFLPTFLLWVMLTYALYRFSKKTITTKPIFKQWYYNSILGILMAAAFVGLTIAGIRGGFRHSTRPITLSNAAKYIDKPIHRAAVLNTPFAMLRTITADPIKRVDYFKDEASLNNYYDPTIWQPQDSSKQLKKDNVMIIILESFSREHFGAYNADVPGYDGFTPFLDSLMDHAMVFERGFANGRKSIDALPSIVAGIPKLDRSFVLLHNSNNDIQSLASVLKPYGYDSAFFHGAPNGSMGFDAFMRQASFDRYYGMNDYVGYEEFDGLWGLWDEPFLQFTADKMNELNPPFLGTFFSLSSHHPFKVPKQYENTFPEGKIPLQKVIAYTDYSLKRFFDRIKNKPWYSETLFVITNDHAAGTDLPRYNNMAEYFSAPMILFHPGDSTLVGWNDSTVIQHLDVMPTVLNYLNYPDPYLSFGADMMDHTADHFAFNVSNGIYQLIVDDYSIQHNGQEIVGIYNYIDDPSMSINLKGQDFGQKDYLVNKSFAVFQQISNRMLDNQLVF